MTLGRLTAILDANTSGLLRANAAVRNFTNSAVSSYRRIGIASGTMSRMSSRHFRKMEVAARNLGVVLLTISAGMNQFNQRLRGIFDPRATNGVLKFASDFDLAFTNVRKTMDGTTEQFKRLKQEFRDMAMRRPQSHVALTRIGAQAGQLGYGHDEVGRFTELMGKLLTTTNLQSSDVALLMARIDNVLDLTMDKLERTSSVIVHLGNNLAATEKEIVDMANRMVNLKAIAGLTTQEIMGLSGAMVSVGIFPEMGGTAMQRVFSRMIRMLQDGGSKLKVLAASSGKSTEEFAKAFNKDKMEGFMSIIQTVHLLQRHGKEPIPFLDALGIKDVREVSTLLKFGSGLGVVHKSLKLAREEFERNAALNIEDKLFREAFINRVKIFGNQLIDVGITIGTALFPALMDLVDMFKMNVLPLIQNAAKAFEQMDRATKLTGLKIIALTVIVTPLLGLFGMMVLFFSLITVKGLVVASVFIGLGAAIGYLISDFDGAVGSVKNFISELERLEAQAAGMVTGGIIGGMVFGPAGIIPGAAFGGLGADYMHQSGQGGKPAWWDLVKFGSGYTPGKMLWEGGKTAWKAGSGLISRGAGFFTQQAHAATLDSGSFGDAGSYDPVAVSTTPVESKTVSRSAGDRLEASFKGLGKLTNKVFKKFGLDFETAIKDPVQDIKDGMLEVHNKQEELLDKLMNSPHAKKYAEDMANYVENMKSTGNEAAKAFSDGFIATLNSGVSGTVSSLLRWDEEGWGGENGMKETLKKVTGNTLLAFVDNFAQFFADLLTNSLEGHLQKFQNGILELLMPDLFKKQAAAPELHPSLSADNVQKIMGSDFLTDAQFARMTMQAPTSGQIMDERILHRNSGWIARNSGINMDFLGAGPNPTKAPQIDPVTGKHVDQSYGAAIENNFHLKATTQGGFFSSLFGSLFSNLGGAFSGFLGEELTSMFRDKPAGKASGGIVTRGMYELGERGPEFVMNAGATRRHKALLNSLNAGADLGSMGGQGVTINNNFESGVTQQQLGGILDQFGAEFYRTIIADMQRPNSIIRQNVRNIR